MLSFRTHVHHLRHILRRAVRHPILGNIVQAMGTAALPRAAQLPFMIGYMLLFLAFGLSAIPVMVMTVLRNQARRGNDKVEPIAMLIRNQNRIIWAMWILILAGTAVALPTMIQSGFFTPQSP